MNRILHILLLAMLPVGSVYGQQYERAVRHNLWNDSDNVAAIRLDSLTISTSSVGGSYKTGDYRLYSESESQWSAGVNAETITHLDKFSMTGGFSFENTEASQMTGSMFLDQGFFPIDVYEFTPGRKTFQSYMVDGGISVDLGRKIKVGAKLDFNSRNAAKRKDLRYSAYRLDMKFAPSILFVLDGYNIGTAFIFNRNTETIDATQIGSAENAPYAFFDEGLMLGNYQVWTGNGTRLNESGVSGLPVMQNVSAGSVQFSKGGFFADIYGGFKNGEVGEKQTIWYRYKGPEFRSKVSYRSGCNTIRTDFGWNRLSNRESVQDKVTEGGLSIVKEYEGNTIYQSNLISFDGEYEYLASAWDVRFILSLSDLQKISTPMYPYVYTRELKRAGFSVNCGYRFERVEVRLNTSYYQGFADESERTVNDLFSSGLEPFRMTELYDNLCKMETCPALSGGLSADWNFTGNFHFVVSSNCVYGLNFSENANYRLNISTALSYIF